MRLTQLLDEKFRLSRYDWKPVSVCIGLALIVIALSLIGLVFVVEMGLEYFFSS